MTNLNQPAPSGNPIQRLWRSGLRGQLTIAGVGALIFCCCLSTVISLAQGGTGISALPTRTERVGFLTSIVLTNTAQPTALPTETPLPTDTPAPTATSTPLPEPIILTGTGDSVVDINKWEGPAIIRVTHNGGGNFAIWNDDAAGNHIELLVNTVGSYQGTLPLDFLDSQNTARFEVTAGGTWEIQVLPLESARRENIPGTFQGTGDDVVVIVSDSTSPDLLKADASAGSGNFAIWAYGNGRDLVINEIAPYTGTVPLDSGAFILAITATGPWSLEITTR